MSEEEASQRGNFSEPIGVGLRGSFAAAARFWEPRRVLYNAVLLAFLAGWVVLTWPHFRPAMTPVYLLQFAMLGVLANVGYCAAYFVDIPVLLAGASAAWSKGRWGLWTAGMLFAILLENYWIADEIYPFVRWECQPDTVRF